MNTLHHLKISLEHVKPAIWREFLVPSDLRLDRLHQVIQIVMGWADCHLHEFSNGVRGPDELRFGPPQREAGFDLDPSVRDERKATLVELAPDKGSRFRYWYDFGDDWFHDITVKAIGESRLATPPLVCLDAAGACPPEDCGGPYGYLRMLDVLSASDHEEYDELREWLGGDFDPAAYDIAAVNAALAKTAARWARSPRKTAKPRR